MMLHAVAGFTACLTEVLRNVWPVILTSVLLFDADHQTPVTPKGTLGELSDDLTLRAARYWQPVSIGVPTTELPLA